MKRLIIFSQVQFQACPSDSWAHGCSVCRIGGNYYSLLLCKSSWWNTMLLRSVDNKFMKSCFSHSSWAGTRAIRAVTHVKESDLKSHPEMISFAKFWDRQSNVGRRRDKKSVGGGGNEWNRTPCLSRIHRRQHFKRLHYEAGTVNNEGLPPIPPSANPP